MRSRPTLAVLLIVSYLVVSVPPAGGWANGTKGCNSFGAHDWILKRAIHASGDEASWIRVRAALRATDDPDCEDGIDHASGTWWHVYDRWGDEYGAADEAARVWLRRTKRRLEDGRERAASRALGVMSHFIADVANPMHTDQSDKEEPIHGPYEDSVDRRIGNYPFHYDGPNPAKPGPRTRQLARQAHKSYWALVNAYDAKGYTRKVHRITKRQLKRGANALADLLSTLR